MEKSKVYFTKNITPEDIVKMYKVLDKTLTGKVAVKLHSGERGKYYAKGIIRIRRCQIVYTERTNIVLYYILGMKCLKKGINID